MSRPRIIPVLLLRGTGLVKTERFRNPRYVGDVINAVRIFNDKQADELIVLDIDAHRRPDGIAWRTLAELASECFMPVCYGGGVRTLEDMRRVFALGFEKVALNTVLHECPELLSDAANEFGCQALVASIDAKRSWLGTQHVVTRGARQSRGIGPAAFAVELERRGAGEILLTSVERDGTGLGYDLDLVAAVTGRVGVPVIACGGAGSLADVARVVREARAAAAGVGRLFVFQGRNRAVLITYPDAGTIDALFP